MILVRGVCECGFFTDKARSGFHHEHWWFPVYELETGQLRDVEVELPEPEQRAIDLALGVKNKAERDNEIRKNFIEPEIVRLRIEFSTSSEEVFNPSIGESFVCPICDRKEFGLNQVFVVGICKPACGHEFRWSDSEQSGCPKCDHRPHSFRTETEEVFSTLPRIRASCVCFSQLDTAVRKNAYCPKCGSPSSLLRVDDKTYCGFHQRELIPYRAVPVNFFGPPPHYDGSRHPNAKIGGEAKPGARSVPGGYCPVCQEDHLEWIKDHPNPW